MAVRSIVIFPSFISDISSLYLLFYFNLSTLLKDQPYCLKKLALIDNFINVIKYILLTDVHRLV